MQQFVGEPPTTQALIAQILERLTNVVDDLKEVKSQNAETNKRLEQIVGVQRDIAHLGSRVEKLEGYVEARAERDPIQDGEIRALKRWQKLVWAAIFGLSSTVGWGLDKVAYFYQVRSEIHDVNTRVSTLELIVNGRSIERAISPNKDPDEAHR